jgi:enoyl-CoA hydratase
MAMRDGLGRDVRAFAAGKMLAWAEAGVGHAVFNQPDKHNAISLDMWDGLAAILDEFAADPGIRAVVLEGAGERAFVSGADIGQFDAERGDAEAQRHYERRTRAGRARLAGFEKPVIAAIRGYCLGGGLGIALAADLRLAAADAVFGIPAARLGLAYGYDMTRALVAAVGPAEARMLLFTGERVSAAEALRMGLVNRVVPVAEFAAAAAALAAQIAQNAPLSIRAAKLAVAAATADPGVRDMAGLEAAIAACFDSADYREGRSAFREKRPPRFTGA